MTDLTYDPLAIAALVGFGALLLICAGIAVWVARKAMTPAVKSDKDAEPETR